MDKNNSWLTDMPIAHRGLHNDIYPENTIAAFKHAIEKGYPIELDVQLISDGTVVVFHDDDIYRLVNVKKKVKDLTPDDLKKYTIKNSDQHIPTFNEVLELVDGKVPLLIEIKNEGKVGALEQKVIDILKDYKGKFVIQSFNPFVLSYFYKHAPHILRGQLSGSFDDFKMNFIKKAILRNMILNKFSKPDFINYETKKIPSKPVKKYKHLPLLAWVVKNKEEQKRIESLGGNIVFENFEPEIK